MPQKFKVYDHYLGKEKTETFKTYLKQLMHLYDVTQADLAGYLGISRQAISQCVLRKKNEKIERLMYLAIVNTLENYLLKDIESMEYPNEIEKRYKIDLCKYYIDLIKKLDN